MIATITAATTDTLVHSFTVVIRFVDGLISLGSHRLGHRVAQWAEPPTEAHKGIGWLGGLVKVTTSWSSMADHDR